MATTSGKGWCVGGVCVGLVLQVAAFDARAQEPRSRGVTVIAEQPMRGVDIELRIESRAGRALCNGGGRCSGQSESGELRVGDRVQICFRVSQAGYVSLWSQDGTAQPVQIYPNEYAPGAGRVDDTQQCLGAQGDGYAFAVEGPAGDSLVFLHYSPQESEQISQGDFPVIRRVRSTGPEPYASSTVTFRIVQ